MRRCGTLEATCGTGSSASHWSSAPRVERTSMTGHRPLGIVLLAAAALAPTGTALSQATKAPGLVQEGNYDAGNLGLQLQPAPRKDDAGAVYTVGPWPTYTPP